MVFRMIAVKHFLTMLASAMTILFTTSCSTFNMHVFDQADKKDTAVLCIGMERGKYGNCPGAQVDATRMRDLLKKYSDNPVLLISQQATKRVVVQAMQAACQKDLAIIFYSGHGGDQRQTNATKQNFVEPSGKDQFLCLYDAPMLDDEIWNIVCGAKGRVVLIFDCCHSGTMYRAPVTFESSLKEFPETFGAEKMPNLLCISGCPDNAYSYGGPEGGLLTNALLERYKEDRTYERVWELLHKDKDLNSQEIVQFAEFGKSFKDYLIFR